MKARIQVGLLKLTNPRVVRALLVGLMLVLLLAQAGVVLADPINGGGSGSGGG